MHKQIQTRRNYKQNKYKTGNVSQNKYKNKITCPKQNAKQKKIYAYDIQKYVRKKCITQESSTRKVDNMGLNTIEVYARITYKGNLSRRTNTRGKVSNRS
jgi:hypothetical protein